jgi:16S rRNA (guanine527-N7)-methyltransferase
MNATLDELAPTWGLSPAQIQQVHTYLGLLEKWNKVYNLTAVRDGPRMLTHHVFDSLSTLPALRKQGPWTERRALDVGSGAGLPGVILAIALPELSVTCIDTVGKKAAFIQQVAGTLQLPNLRSVHARVEQWTDDAFDLVISRAFASLTDFTQWSHQHLSPTGVWMAMKGKTPSEEIAALPPTISVFHVEQLSVPELPAERCLVWMRKTKAST